MNRRRWFEKLKEVVGDAGHAIWINPWSSKQARFDLSTIKEATEFFDRHGWVIFKGVFSAEEIADIRDRVERSKNSFFEGDHLSDKHLGGSCFVFNERILQIVSGILRGAPCYFGDSSASVDIGISGFHKDNPDKEDQEAPDWQGNYSLVRIGLYLQDHAWHSGGLAVRDQSHTTINKLKGRPIAVPTEAGDVVLWSLRTTHSGYAMRARVLPGTFVPIPIASLLAPPGRSNRSLLSRIFRPLEHDKRMAIFATYGIDDQHLQRYLAYLQTRQYAVHCWQATTYDEQDFSDAKDHGLKLISMREHVGHIDWRTLNSTHAYFPWRRPGNEKHA